MGTLCSQSRRSYRKRLLFQCDRFDALAALAVFGVVINSHFARKLVSVEFAAFGLVFPTFNFGFCTLSAKNPQCAQVVFSTWKSFFLFSFFFFELVVMMAFNHSQDIYFDESVSWRYSPRA
jgi:hypothetical protein